MAKRRPIFTEIYIKLFENVIPSIISSLQELGMKYMHIHIHPQHALCFFNHLQINCTFLLENLHKIKDDNGNDVPVILFNIRFDGQISVSENIAYATDGLATLSNTIVLFEDYSKMFDGVKYENVFLFHLAKELTSKAQQLQNEIIIVKSLLNDMDKITPSITREVLVEKKSKTKK